MSELGTKPWGAGLAGCKPMESPYPYPKSQSSDPGSSATAMAGLWRHAFSVPPSIADSFATVACGARLAADSALTLSHGGHTYTKAAASDMSEASSWAL